MADGKGATAIFCAQCDNKVFQKITLSLSCDTAPAFAKGKPSLFI